MAASPAAFITAPARLLAHAHLRAHGRPATCLRPPPSAPARTRPGVRTGVRCAQQVDWKRVQLRATEAVTSARAFLSTTTGQATVWGLLLWLLLTGRAGWLFDSMLFLLFVFSVVPIVGIFVLRWWLSRQVVNGSCPACGAKVTGLRGRPIQCFSCGHVSYGEAASPSASTNARSRTANKSTNFSVGDPASATIDIEAKRID